MGDGFINLFLCIGRKMKVCWVTNNDNNIKFEDVINDTFLHMNEKNYTIDNKCWDIDENKEIPDPVTKKYLYVNNEGDIIAIPDVDIKTTVKGLPGLKNFNMLKKVKLLNEFNHCITGNSKDVFRVEEFYSMRRHAFHVNVNSEHRTFKPTVYEQYDVRRNRCYPKYYNK